VTPTAAPSRDELVAALDETAVETGFSGVVRVDRPGEPPVESVHGLADRAHGVPMSVDTRIGVASGGKTFTGLTVLRLVEDGVLALGTPARSLLVDDLPLVDDAVTVEHLLCHRSGIGDYLDESQLESDTDYVLPVPVHTLDTAESYLTVLDGFPQAFAPGSDFAYCNGGFCVLALLAERAAGEPFHHLVRRLVVEPAGLDRTAYLRSDELPGDAALGYLDATGPRTNVLHLPVVGGGDGGIYTTAGDLHRLWDALDAGQVVSAATRDDAWRSRSDLPDDEGYGLGFWRRGAAIEMHGADAGASFRSVHVPGQVTWTVLSNTTHGAWPVIRRVTDLLAGCGPPR
jgi:CubicO group peptidase (beta-lactamase class C family)